MQSNITITWGDWFDDLSGLREYKYQIHTVSYRNSILQEDGLLNDEREGTIHLNETFVSSSCKYMLFDTCIYKLYLHQKHLANSLF